MSSIEALRSASEMNMASRPRLDEAFLAPAVLAGMESFRPELVREVQQAIGSHAVVVVGMAQNPHVKNVRRALTAAGIEHAYLEYGSYFSKWKERLAIKLWSGWPTFPQVFVRGVLIGGADLTNAALADGSLKSSAALLAAPVTSSVAS
jgi:monothiol glutaredoxin